MQTGTVWQAGPYYLAHRASHHGSDIWHQGSSNQHCHCSPTTKFLNLKGASHIRWHSSTGQICPVGHGLSIPIPNYLPICFTVGLFFLIEFVDCELPARVRIYRVERPKSTYLQTEHMAKSVKENAVSWLLHVTLFIGLFTAHFQVFF